MSYTSTSNYVQNDCDFDAIANLVVFGGLCILIFFSVVYAMIHCLIMVLRNTGYSVNLTFHFHVKDNEPKRLQNRNCNNLESSGDEFLSETEEHTSEGEMSDSFKDHKEQDVKTSNSQFVEDFMTHMYRSNPNTTNTTFQTKEAVKEIEEQEQARFAEACKRSCDLKVPVSTSDSTGTSSSTGNDTLGSNIEDTTGGATKSYMHTGKYMKFGDSLPNVNVTHSSTLQPTSGTVNVKAMMETLGLREYQ